MRDKAVRATATKPTSARGHGLPAQVVSSKDALMTGDEARQLRTFLADLVADEQQKMATANLVADEQQARNE